jgi:pimeloyl-ACP methyl ester carboxylesterase
MIRIIQEVRPVVLFIALLLTSSACAQSTAKPETGATPPADQATEKPAPPGASAANASPGKPAPPPAPKPKIAKSADGTQIAYEVTGSGPALILVHGGGQTRRSWNQIGYVERLAKRFTVITMDLRGSGDSDRPVTAEAYALDTVLADFLAVADATGAKSFHIWGFGHGGTLARYLAARSDRVISAVLVGMTMGPAASGVFKTAVEAMKAKWQPVIAAHAAGTLDLKTLSTSDRTAWEAGIAPNVLSLTALLDYPPLEPAEIKVPTLWAVGSDDSAMENVKEYEGKLKGTQVTLKVLSSVNYSDSFIKVEQVIGEIEPFLTKTATATTWR